MLPAAEGICPLIFLIFSPFASLKADRKGRRYQCVKIKRKVEETLKFNLLKIDID
jgi:hypothetical protein